jgi:DNA-binding SARP family transcriptional activator/pimeloyl-ACP methyl ester carboxylesterase
VRLAVLGPVTLVGNDDEQVAISPRQARELLTLLALEHPRPLSLDALAGRLWDVPPPASTKTIQGLLSRLRRALTSAGVEGGGIIGGPAGYRLADVGELDVTEFQRLARAGRQAMHAGTWPLAVSALGRARTLIRGAPELPVTAAGHAQRAWLAELHDAVAEDHMEAAIHAGHSDIAIADLELLTVERPLSERLWELRMLALAHAGRVAEALRTHVAARTVLIEQTGLEPGDGLRRLERELLAGRIPPVSSPVAARAATAASISDAGATQPPVRYVAVDDVHIAYCSLGEADRDLVIMNGGTMPVDCVMSEPRLAAAVHQMTTFARVTWFNHRGIGLSDRCTADQLPTVHDWECDLVAVLDAIGATAPVVYAYEDTTAVVFELAARRPDRLAGIVLTNAYARFTRGDGYPYGIDPVLAEQGVAETTAAHPSDNGFDLLSMISPSVAGDAAFRAWWDNAGRRGATPQVARALRSRHQNADLRGLVPKVDVPVLHLVNPTSPAHDPGHDRYLATHLPDVETCELPGPDEFWWLDRSGTFLAQVERFVRLHGSRHEEPTEVTRS